MKGLKRRVSPCASNAANAAFYAVVVTPSNNISVQYRDATGGSAAILTTITGAAPAYIEVIRKGTTFSVATSNDGKTWAPNAASSRSMPTLSGSVLMGLAITSHSAGALASAIFDQITVTPTVPSGVTVTSPAAPSGVTSYPIQTTYNDAGMPTQTTYSDNETLGYTYDSASAWLTGLTATPQGGTATQLLSTVSYSGAGGAVGHITGASVGGLYSYAASYDTDTRLTALSLTRSSDSTLLFSSQRGYDAVGNVTSVLTTLPAGTDSQTFCYDEQNRLVWASSANTIGPCGSNAAGSLSGASYSETDSYDTLDRLTSGPLGAYTYGDAAHLHAVTSIGPSGSPTYTASYDAAGNMICRAPTNTTTCVGTPTGATLAFDTEGRLASWTGGVTTDSFLYDGAGNRVAQQVTVNGTNATTTTYVDGGQEEIVTSGSSSTLTKYFAGKDGVPVAERVGTNGPLDYLASDGQGSVSAALDSNGNVTFEQLYTPYGNVRYSSGASPTAFGYTGQRADAATGLDYYNARYYDPVAQQFVSADSVSDGLSRYGYVGGNPETATDPSGHLVVCGTCGNGGNGYVPPAPPGGYHCYSNCGGNPSGPQESAECGTYTAAQCAQAKSAQFAAVKTARKWAGLWQLLVGAVGVGVDLYQFGKDMGKWSINTAVSLGIDIAGLAIDASLLLEGFGNEWAGWFGDSGWLAQIRQVGQTLGAIGAWVKAGLNVIKANTSFWVNIAKASFLALILMNSAEITSSVDGAMELVNSIDSVITVALGAKWSISSLIGAGVAILQGLATDQATHADDLAGETPYGYCTSADGRSDHSCPTT